MHVEVLEGPTLGLDILEHEFGVGDGDLEGVALVQHLLRVLVRRVGEPHVQGGQHTLGIFHGDKALFKFPVLSATLVASAGCCCAEPISLVWSFLSVSSFFCRLGSGVMDRDAGSDAGTGTSLASTRSRRPCLDATDFSSNARRAMDVPAACFGMSKEVKSVYDTGGKENDLCGIRCDLGILSPGESICISIGRPRVGSAYPRWPVKGNAGFGRAAGPGPNAFFCDVRNA